MEPPKPPKTAGDMPARPTTRFPAAALLLGSAVAMGALLVFDLYGMLPPDLLAPFASFGPPARVLLVIIVFAEALAAAYLVSAGKHPMDGPFITHYGTRTLAAGGIMVGAGIAAYVVWATAGEFILAGSDVLMESSIVAMIAGAALLLSALAVLASAIVSPWIVRRAS